MMVDIPCLPSQTFWCLAVRNDKEKYAENPLVEEIILAEKPEHAKRQIEEFWKSKCAAILSQEDVQKLLAQLKEFPLEPDATSLPQPSFFDKLMGKSISQRNKSERFYISGTDANGDSDFAIVAAQSLPMAYVQVSAQKPGFNPSSGYSQFQLSNLLDTMESARTGCINVARALSSEDPLESAKEISTAFRRARRNNWDVCL